MSSASRARRHIRSNNFLFWPRQSRTCKPELELEPDSLHGSGRDRAHVYRIIRAISSSMIHGIPTQGRPHCYRPPHASPAFSIPKWRLGAKEAVRPHRASFRSFHAWRRDADLVSPDGHSAMGTRRRGGRQGGLGNRRSRDLSHRSGRELIPSQYNALINPVFATLFFRLSLISSFTTNLTNLLARPVLRSGPRGPWTGAEVPPRGPLLAMISVP